MAHVVNWRWFFALTALALLLGSCQSAGTPQGVVPYTGATSLVLYRWEGVDGSFGGGIVDVESGETTLLPERQPLGWSPSHRLLLLREPGSRLVVAHPRGEEPRSIFQTEEGFRLLDARWLTDETVLVSVGESALPPLPLHTYAVSVATGAATLLEPDVPRYIEAVSPDGSYWVESLDQRLDVVRLDGTRQELDVGIPIRHSPFDAAYRPSLGILPNGEGLAFVSCPESDGISPSCGLYVSRVFPSAGYAPRRLPDHADNSGIQYLRVSRDGRYLAGVSADDNSFLVYRLAEATEPEAFPWGQRNAAPDFVWSPSGTAISAEYFDASRGDFVIEIIDIQTGERRVVLRNPSARLIPVDWAIIESAN